MDVASAQKARGLKLDVEDTVQGKAFKVDNPNAPEPVGDMQPEELKRLVDAGETLHLIDVRPPDERERAAIDGAVALDEGGMTHIESLPRDALLVFYCHTGQRSRGAAEHFRLQGFSNVHNLDGGIDAWSKIVDPGVPRY
jgi:monothiol glutaredoxin